MVKTLPRHAENENEKMVPAPTTAWLQHGSAGPIFHGQHRTAEHYRCTLQKAKRYDGKEGYFHQDRSMTARVRPLKEGKFHPSLLLGVDDPFKNTGINYFATVYGALTKGFSIAKGDRLALTAGYYFPLNDHSIKDGPFGGISYSPAFCREMTVMAEYDSEGFNVGAAARLWRHLSIHVFTREFNSISGGIRYECRLLH